VDCRNGSGRDHRGFGPAAPPLLRITSEDGDEALSDVCSPDNAAQIARIMLSSDSISVHVK